MFAEFHCVSNKLIGAGRAKAFFSPSSLQNLLPSVVAKQAGVKGRGLVLSVGKVRGDARAPDGHSNRGGGA